ncbi:hypothetical protein Z517_06482 [Fonsecaea pedrosoi CBS 271.37]|uniref:Enoyl reductase (ER) domain-containing protein n=1 Tax=Fonsecaea pedrosoi CBS 271.37 TaxID=1442368 RepID=A0A0D2EZV4_9EURO|nr:uncharacterized protein Z517_06482 [Fonsecaea pedrosoi CBS 271.37]KIW79867.1 hypothetical protein Z517_06482 [Fonsecaea pedrosoi CBS 271.37]
MTAADIPKTMLAWQKHFGTHGPVRVEIPVPSISEDGLLVKIRAAGVCHSDINLIKFEVKTGSWFRDKYTLGHEGAGEVVRVGPNVKNFRVGDMVAIHPGAGCMQSTCRPCSIGQTQFCERGDHHGVGEDGSFAPYIAIKAASAIKMPLNVSFAEGAVAMDSIMTAYHAVVQRAAAQNEETVLLYGLGGLGFSALQILLHIGSRVIVVDQKQTVLDQAVKFGVKEEDVVPPETQNVAEWIQKKGLVPDKAIDFVGSSGTFKASCEAVRPGGTIVLVGMFEDSVTFYHRRGIRKGLNVLCSLGGTYADAAKGLELVSAGVISPQVELRSLFDLPQALYDLDCGKVKGRIVLVPEDRVV